MELFHMRGLTGAWRGRGGSVARGAINPVVRPRGGAKGLLDFNVALAAPGVAQACSRDDATFYETFLDTTCLQTPLNSGVDV